MQMAKGYEIATCNNCSFRQVLQPPADVELEHLYSNLHVSHIKYRDKQATYRENKTRFNLTQRFVAAGQLVLDAGCATGDFLAVAKDHYVVYGVDISESAIEHARRRMPDIAAQIFSLKLENLSDQLPKFDAICMWDVVEHVRDPVSVCRALMSILKPGGYLLLSTPDVESLTSKVMKQHWAFMIPPLHLGYFSRRSLAYLFARQVPGRILEFLTRGKWTTLTFLAYKINQINSWLAPQALLNGLSRSRFGRINIYIPTNDIIYLVVKKSDELGN
jgi:2-polyprenyl-3-methyl-5-hydroxy-6-metoxy-1,4-benzoquinol methylase